MIGRAGYDLAKWLLRAAFQLWPLFLFWFAWGFADGQWQIYLAGNPHFLILDTGDLRSASPIAALAGPAVVMAVAVALYRIGLGSRTMALVGVAGMAAVAVLTGWSEFSRLWPYVGDPRYSSAAVFNAFDLSRKAAIVVGLMAAFVGYCIATRARPFGSDAAPALRRSNSDNFGHANWLSMDRARAEFSGPDPAYGGLVVGEAYRVDEDAVAKRHPRFDPANQRSWGMGGKAPLLVDPCKGAATHALVFAGAGGFKTTASAIPTLLTWTGAAIVLDPSCELGPMLQTYREQALGHQVVLLDPGNAKDSGFNVLDWIDIASPKAEQQVKAVVRWICGDSREESGSSRFFGGRGRGLILSLLADLLWDSGLPAEQKTLRTLRRRIVTPEDEMRELLERIYATSPSQLARDYAGSIKGAVKETFSGIYQNADEDTSWLSISAYADLVSGNRFRASEVTRGKLTVFVQIPLDVLEDDPAVGRVVIGALLNAAYAADGKVSGRVLFLLDEVARLGYMRFIETARDAGRKYGITMMLLYQSLGQLVAQWGVEGKRSWYDSSAWRLFATVQDPDTARELSAICGEYTVVTTSTGDTEGNQSRGAMGSSSSSGRSENRSETKRALIKPEELMHDCRADEAFVIRGGSPPLRCGRAIYFRRPEWANLVGKNRFHRDAAE